MKTSFRILAVLAVSSAFCGAADTSTTPPSVNPSTTPAAPATSPTPATAPEAPKHHHDPKKSFNKLDTNHDGFLSLEEFEASKKGQKKPSKAEKTFRKMDTNGDGKVSLEEFIAYHEQHAGKRGKNK